MLHRYAVQIDAIEPFKRAWVNFLLVIVELPRVLCVCTILLSEENKAGQQTESVMRQKLKTVWMGTTLRDVHENCTIPLDAKQICQLERHKTTTQENTVKIPKTRWSKSNWSLIIFIEVNPLVIFQHLIKPIYDGNKSACQFMDFTDAHSDESFFAPSGNQTYDR